MKPSMSRPGALARVVGSRGWYFAIAVTVNLLVLMIAVGQAYDATTRGDAADADRVAAENVRRLSEDVLLDLVDAETGQRGYLLTGDRTFLQPYTDALSSVPGRLTLLEDIAAPEDLVLARAVAMLAEIKLDELQLSIETFDSDGPAAAQELVIRGGGKGVMDGIRANVGQLVLAAGERAKVSANAAERERDTAQATAALTALFLALNLLGMLLLLRQRGRWERQRGELLDELENLASRDALTGLLNRRLLRDRLEHAISRAVRSGTDVAVAYLDLDGFKPVNDLLGHAAGDAVLVEVADRLNAAVRDSDTVARVGGDEFVVLVEDFSGDVTRSALLARLTEATSFLAPAPGRPGEDPLTLPVSASVGLVTLKDLGGQGGSTPDPAVLASRLLGAADQVMYDQKLRLVARAGGRAEGKPARSTRHESQA